MFVTVYYLIIKANLVDRKKKMCSADHSVIYGKVSLFDRTLCMDLTRGKHRQKVTPWEVCKHTTAPSLQGLWLSESHPLTSCLSEAFESPYIMRPWSSCCLSTVWAAPWHARRLTSPNIYGGWCQGWARLEQTKTQLQKPPAVLHGSHGGSFLSLSLMFYWSWP